MITAIIIDDEPLAIESLQTLIKNYCSEIEILATANSALSGIKEINKHLPQLVFLDIDMPNGNGFDLLEAFPNRDFTVVFTTASSEYAIKAIKAHAADYLLKPIDIDELIVATEKVKLQFQPKTITNSSQIALPSSQGLKVIDIDKIVRLEANDNYTYFYIDGEKSKIIVSKTMKEYEEILPTKKFYRIHQSHIINLSYLDSYIKGRGGQVILKDGTYLDVSVRKKDEFLTRLIGKVN